MGQESEIRALISLIDDPDEEIFSNVRQRIIELADEIVPTLEDAWDEKGGNAFLRGRIDDLLHDIHIQDVSRRLKAWVENGGEDLLKGSLIVNRYPYQNLNVESIMTKFDKLEKDIRTKINDSMSPFEKVKICNFVLFREHGLRGDKRDYHALRNSFISRVLETRKGNPLTLSIIYQVLGERLGLPIYGVNLPNHFILAYMEEKWMGDSEEGASNAIFYINPFSEGDILGRSDISEFLVKLEIKSRPYFYAPCTNLDIVRRQLVNILSAYDRAGELERMEEVQKLLAILPKSES